MARAAAMLTDEDARRMALYDSTMDALLALGSSITDAHRDALQAVVDDDRRRVIPIVGVVDMGILTEQLGTWQEPEPCLLCGRRHPGPGTPGVCDA